MALLEKGAYKGMDACLMYVLIQFFLIGLIVTDRVEVSSCSWPYRIGELKQLSCVAEVVSRV